MRLNQFAAQLKREIFDDLILGKSPRLGDFDPAVLDEARAKGKPSIGATRYEPGAIVLEFIYSNPQGAAIIVSVRTQSPERIVFLPVPEWVVESIWQGEIAGSYEFERDAVRMLERFRDSLNPDSNAAIFGRAPRVSARD